MTRKYKYAPIVEALCEFRFDDSTAWDMTLPGLVYKNVKDAFPLARTAQVVETRVVPDGNNLQHTLSVSARSQLLRADEKAMIQIGERLFAVNRLAPYESWTEFFPLIQQGFVTFCEQAKPKEIVRIGLRYVNVITIPSDEVQLEDYFAFRPATPPELSSNLSAFICGAQVARPELNSTLKVELANRPADPGASAFLLDLDHYTSAPCTPSFDEVFAWVERAHSELENAFEACILDQLREIFGEEK